MTVEVQYVDGGFAVGPVDGWRYFRAEGVDAVIVNDPSGSVRVASASLYWLRRDGADWVLGTGSVGYSDRIVEIVFDGHGGQRSRTLDYLPDLQHADLKLGHWWPGTSAPV